MADESRPASAVRKAKDHFAAAGQRDADLRKAQATAKAANLAKMASLRAQRLARDAAEQKPVEPAVPTRKAKSASLRKG